MKYAKDDLIIVDWDGAVIFGPGGEADAAIELLQLANLQFKRFFHTDFFQEAVQPLLFDILD